MFFTSDSREVWVIHFKEVTKEIRCFHLVAPPTCLISWSPWYHPAAGRRKGMWATAHLMFSFLVVEVTYVTHAHIPLSESGNGKPNYREAGKYKRAKSDQWAFTNPMTPALPLSSWSLGSKCRTLNLPPFSLSVRSHHFIPLGLLDSDSEISSLAWSYKQFDQHSFYGFTQLKDELLSWTGPRTESHLKPVSRGYTPGWFQSILQHPWCCSTK